MSKPYVIVHMYTSIDGRIKGRFFGQQDRKESGTYYDDVIFQKGDALVIGRATAQNLVQGQADLTAYPPAPQGDFVVKAAHYLFVFDRMGKCFYTTPKASDVYDYGTEDVQFVAVVSSACDKRYLSFLRETGVGYLVADTAAQAAEKMTALFDVKRLVVGGGGLINGGFLAEDLVDEISLVVAPYVEGDDSIRTSFSVSEFVPTKFRFVQATPFADGGVELIFRR